MKLKNIAVLVLFYIYDILFVLGFIIYLPFYFYRKKISLASFKERLGIRKKAKTQNCIWIQAVSVGEVIMLKKLLVNLKQEFNRPIVVSTTTLTGNNVAKKNLSHLARVIFFPLDISYVIGKTIAELNPEIFIALETEMWPNLFRQLKSRNIPVLIINGRISDKAFKRYLLVKPFIRKVINQCDYIGVQNNCYKNRFLSLGGDEEKIVITGNLKFSTIIPDEGRKQEIKEKYGNLLKRQNSTLIIAASTHSPEEKIIIDIYTEIADKNDITLLVAPRHTEKIPAVEKYIAAKGLKPVRISNADQTTDGKNCVFLLDTVGDLLYFYNFSDICFVGGSLVKHGGHNILEPIFLRKPTCFGPYMNNFKDIESIALAKNAGIKVNSADELKQTISRLLVDRKLREDLIEGCNAVFEQEKFSLEKNMEIIKRCLSNG